MKKEPTFNDFNSASPKELQRHYGLSDRSLEKQFRRKALDGATQREMRREYEKFYTRNRKNA